MISDVLYIRDTLASLLYACIRLQHKRSTAVVTATGLISFLTAGLVINLKHLQGSQKIGLKEADSKRQLLPTFQMKM